MHFSNLRVLSKHVKKSAVIGERKQGGKSLYKVALSSNDFVFSRSTINSSVCTEDNSHLIRPISIKFVNTNGDAWSNDSLKSNYRSFIGAYNFVNHVQDHDKSVGFIADAALRRIILSREENASVYYTDILVATHRDYSDVVSKVLSNEIEFMSMGCEAFKSQCSKCGEVFTEEGNLCDHLTFEKGKTYIDGNGKRRIVAELLGNAEDGSVEFIEASWLTQIPAFGGACRRHSLAIPDGTDVEIEFPEEVLSKPAMERFISN